MTKSFINLDGQVLSANTALIDSLAPGKISGVGAFETMRAYDGKIFAFDEHFARFKKGLQICKVGNGRDRSLLKTSLNSFKKSAHDLLKKNHLKAARVRMAVWEENKEIHSLIVTLPFKPYSPRDRRRGFKAIISNLRCDETKTHPDLKSLDYGLYLKACGQAGVQRVDEAILLNKRGELCEGSRSNIFYVTDKTLDTPALSSGCLNGITRKIVLTIARQMKIPCQEVAVPAQKLFEAREAFFTNSLIEIMPLTQLEGRSIGNGEAGPISKEIIKKYQILVKTSL